MRISQMISSFAIVLMACIHSAHAAEAVDARPSPLPSLDGHWAMIGDVMGKPVQYDLDAFPTLQGKFTEMHMVDVQVPSKYEARVFIGADTSGQLIVHWLDSFGASYSVPHGTGAITGNTVAFSFPYPSGQFRDTLTYDPKQGTWSLVIESAKPDGTWGHFAKYEIRRKPAEPSHASTPTH